MFKYMRVFIVIVGVNFILILFYWNFKGYYWTTPTEQYNILELESLERLINFTIDKSIYQAKNSSYTRDINFFDDNSNFLNTNLSSIDKKLLTIEEELFDSDYTGPTSAPVDTQLFYVDLVRYVRDYRIGKTSFCAKHPNLRTVIFVWSRVNGCAQRDAIRQTWAHNTYSNDSSVKVLFVIGSSNSQADMSKVIEEDNQYDDILQFQLTDSYHNCTLKSIGVLRWTQFFCKNVQFIMKTDDDIVVNTKNLHDWSVAHSNSHMSIYGILAKNWGVNRNKKSKWYIAPDIYRGHHFPDFIVAAHLMTADCVSVLYAKALKTLPAFWLEDVYITGVLPDKTSIKRINLSKFVKLDWIKKPLSKELFDQNICIGHDLGAKSMYKFWDKYTKVT